jgi:hypothetical protein
LAERAATAPTCRALTNRQKVKNRGEKSQWRVLFAPFESIPCLSAWIGADDPAQPTRMPAGFAWFLALQFDNLRYHTHDESYCAKKISV